MERKNIKFNFLVTVFVVYALVILLACGTVLFRACFPYEKYNEKWIIGKTKAEIEERYGEFDLKFDVGTYVYKVKESRRGFFGTDPEEFFAVFFDENGVAYKVKEKYYRPGG